MSIFGRAWSSIKDLFGGVGVTEAEVEAALIAGGLEAEMLALADEVEDYWKSIAPEFGDKDPRGRAVPGIGPGGTYMDTKKYKDSVEVRVESDGVFPHIRVGSSDMPLAEWLEYGSVHNPEYGYAQRVVDHFRNATVDLHMNEG